MTPRYVIADLDPGTDDAWALAILLKAEKTHNVKILAITIVAGNTETHHGVNNVARVLESFNRTDIPVFSGAQRAFIQMDAPSLLPFHGIDGFADLDWETQPNLSVVQKEPAANAMQRLTSKYPKQITLICCGPLTNVALAIKLYSNFADNIKDVHIMGGNYLAVGNTKSRCTEFNFYMDTEAAQIVLNSLKCPITLLPLETANKSIPIDMSWRSDVVGAVDHPFVQIMNRIEHKLFRHTKPYWPMYDLLLVACWLFPDVIRRQAFRNCDVELHGGQTRGMVVINRRSATGSNVNVIELVNQERAKEIVLWAVSP